MPSSQEEHELSPIYPGDHQLAEFKPYPQTAAIYQQQAQLPPQYYIMQWQAQQQEMHLSRTPDMAIPPPPINSEPHRVGVTRDSKVGAILSLLLTLAVLGSCVCGIMFPMWELASPDDTEAGFKVGIGMIKATLIIEPPNPRSPTTISWLVDDWNDDNRLGRMKDTTKVAAAAIALIGLLNVGLAIIQFLRLCGRIQENGRWTLVAVVGVALTAAGLLMLGVNMIVGYDDVREYATVLGESFSVAGGLSATSGLGMQIMFWIGCFSTLVMILFAVRGCIGSRCDRCWMCTLTPQSMEDVSDSPVPPGSRAEELV